MVVPALAEDGQAQIEVAPVTPIASARRPPRAVSWMVTRLAEETDHLHAGIDQLVLASLAEPTLPRYRHYLARIYGFDAPLASRLLATSGLDATFIVPRIRASWLASDLMGLGFTAPESAMLQRRPSIPAFSSPAEALGWLYVSERLTLRHDFIRAKVRAAIPAVYEHAGDYLGATWNYARIAWRELGLELDRVAHDEAAAQQIVTAVPAALESQYAWLSSTVFDGE